MSRYIKLLHWHRFERYDVDNWKLSIGYILECDLIVHFRVDYLNLSTNLELADAVAETPWLPTPPPSEVSSRRNNVVEVEDKKM